MAIDETEGHAVGVDDRSGCEGGHRPTLTGPGAPTAAGKGAASGGMDADPKLYWGAVLEAPDATRLAEFYAALLGWRVVDAELDWATISPP